MENLNDLTGKPFLYLKISTRRLHISLMDSYRVNLSLNVRLKVF